MTEFAKAMRRQQVLADFGEFTLRSQNLDDVLTEACRLVGDALETRRAKILEIQRRKQSLLVRAGVGWDPGVVGHVSMPMAEHTSETFAIKIAQPVVSQNINEDDRFGVPPFMVDAGVVALINVPIILPGGQPFGLLQVDDTKPRDFDDDDIQFLRTYAVILGPVIDRLLMARVLQATEERFRQFAEESSDAIWIRNAETFQFEYLSPAVEAIYGESREAFAGRRYARTLD